MTLKSSR